MICCAAEGHVPSGSAAVLLAADTVQFSSVQFSSVLLNTQHFKEYKLRNYGTFLNNDEKLTGVTYRASCLQSTSRTVHHVYSRRHVPCIMFTVDFTYRASCLQSTSRTVRHVYSRRHVPCIMFTVDVTHRASCLHSTSRAVHHVYSGLHVPCIMFKSTSRTVHHVCILDYFRLRLTSAYHK